MISHHSHPHMRHIWIFIFSSLVKSRRLSIQDFATNHLSWSCVESCIWFLSSHSPWCHATGPSGNIFSCIYPDIMMLRRVSQHVIQIQCVQWIHWRSSFSCNHRAMSERAVPIGIYRSASNVISSKCWMDQEIIPSPIDKNTQIHTRYKICVQDVSLSSFHQKSCMYVATANSIHPTTQISQNLRGLRVKWTIDPEINQIHRKYIRRRKYPESNFFISVYINKWKLYASMITFPCSIHIPLHTNAYVPGTASLIVNSTGSHSSTSLLSTVVVHARLMVDMHHWPFVSGVIVNL